MAVFLADEQSLKVDADDLVALARYVVAERRVPADMEVALLLVERDVMAGLNEKHMGQSGPTDVLAFPIDEPGETPPDAPAILGDVVLCPDVAAEQAPKFARSTRDELRLLTVHGLLHLLGMDHAEETEKREMFGLTEELLSGFAAGRTPE